MLCQLIIIVLRRTYSIYGNSLLFLYRSRKMGYGLISPGKRFTAINKGTPFGVPQSGSVFTYPSSLIGIYRRAHIIRQRASISAAVSSGYLVLCGSNNIRPLPGPDRRQRHYLGRCKESFMGDGTAGLCSHLPCVADIAHTAGCHAENQGGGTAYPTSPTSVELVSCCIFDASKGWTSLSSGFSRISSSLSAPYNAAIFSRIISLVSSV